MHHQFVLNNNPYTIIEWGVLSLYGLFLYKLTTILSNKSNDVLTKTPEIQQIPETRRIIIVKRVIKSASTDKELRKQIAIHLKENGCTRPYFLSIFTDPHYNKIQHESRISHEIFNTFLIKLYKTNNSLIIMNRNEFEWEYEPYITLGKMNNITIEMAYI